MLLHRTQDVLAEQLANNPQPYGGHVNPAVRVGSNGFVVGEVPFDYGTHDVSHIDPFSLAYQVSGMPHVREVQPDSPLEATIVVHNDPLEQAHNPEWITEAKLWLAGLLVQALEASTPSSFDGMDTFVVGAPAPSLQGKRMRYLAGTDNPQAAVEAIIDSCRQGLTFIISTFQNLPFREASRLGALKGNAIGVKADHLFEVELPPGVGIWLTGDPDMPAVNTGSPRKLSAWNEKSFVRHNQLLASLGQLGISMATAVFDRRYEPHGFDVRAADRSIARALKQRKKH